MLRQIETVNNLTLDNRRNRRCEVVKPPPRRAVVVVGDCLLSHVDEPERLLRSLSKQQSLVVGLFLENPTTTLTTKEKPHVITIMAYLHNRTGIPSLRATPHIMEWMARHSTGICEQDCLSNFVKNVD